MTWHGIQPWQLPIFVTIAIVLLEVVGDAVLRTGTSPEVRRHIRTGALVLLVLLTIVIGVMAIGTSMADQLASVGALVLTGVTLMLAVRSHQSPRPEPKPIDSRPVGSEPVGSEPVASEPVGSEPVASELVGSEPVASEPGDRGPEDPAGGR